MGLLELAEIESDDAELIPEILPADARLIMQGPTSLLLYLFDRAASVAPLKEIIPDTSYALLSGSSAMNGAVSYATIQATDGATSLLVTRDGITVKVPGDVLLPARKMFEILKKAADETTVIEVFSDVATIRSGRTQWSVKTTLRDELPTLPDIDAIPTQGVSVAAFLRALKATRAAAPSQDSRPSMMQLHAHAGMITGTNAARLHRVRVDGLKTDMDIPIRVADELIRALTKTSEEFVQVGASDAYLVFGVGSDILIGQKLLVKFPNVEKLILGPALSNTHLLVVNRVDLADVVQRVRINADPDYNAILLTLLPKGNVWKLAIHARDRTGNTAREYLDVAWDGGRIPEMAVNYRYLLEMLAAYPGDECFFKLGDDTKSTKNPLYLEDEPLGFVGYVQQMNVV